MLDPRPAPDNPQAPTTRAAALEAIARAEAAFVAAVEAQLAAQRTDPGQGAVAAAALEAGLDALIRARWGAPSSTWVRRTALGRVVAVHPRERIAEMRVAPVGAGPVQVERVTYGAGQPVVGQSYPVYFPVRLPDAPTPLLPGPVPAGLPWMKAPAAGRWLYWKEPNGRHLWRYGWPPPTLEPPAAPWTSELVRDDVPPPWELFGSSTPPADDPAGTGTEIVFREQLTTRVPQEQGFDDFPQWASHFHHYGAMGFGPRVRDWAPTPAFALPQAIANEGQTVAGGAEFGGTVSWLGGMRPSGYEVVLDVQT
jgi:hypothetical protein